MPKAHASTFRMYENVKDLPEGLWDRAVSDGHPFKSQAYFEAIEQTCAGIAFRYLVALDGETPVAVFMVTMEVYDLATHVRPGIARAIRFIRKLSPTFLAWQGVMTGCELTSTRHWWFDEARMDSEAFVAQALGEIQKQFPRARLVMIRNFTSEDPFAPALKSALEQRHFWRAPNLPLAVVRLGAPGALEAHYAGLKKKARGEIRRNRKTFDDKGYTFSDELDFGPLVDELYPLYLAVNEHAKEMRSEPVPKRFFEDVARTMKGTAFATIAREPGGKIVAFALNAVTKEIADVLFVGFDYGLLKEVAIYRNLLWRAIAACAERGAQVIDVGVSSYFVKKDFGAVTLDMEMSIQIRLPILGKLFPRIMNALLARKRRIDARRAKDAAGSLEKGAEEREPPADR